MNTTSQGTAGVSQLDATLNALLGGLPAAAGLAGDNIAGWINTLRGNPQLAPISSELQRLHDHLASGAPDTGALADSLRTLGQQTAQAASHATPDAQAKLQQLGQALTAAAGSLAA